MGKGGMPPQMYGMQQGMMGAGGPPPMYFEGMPGAMMGGMPGKGMPGMMGGMPGKGMPGMQGQMMGGMPGMGPGGPRPDMAQGQRPPQPMAQPEAGQTGPAPLTASALAAAPPGMQKQMLGEKLFPMVAKYQPELAGKITGMMLEMDNGELLMLLESEQQLKVKVDEALRVLQGK